MVLNRSVTWRLMLVLLTLVIGLRALIPAGYMPDFGALAKGQVEMVVCTQNGPVTMLIDAAFDPDVGTATQHAPDTSSDHDAMTGLCMFATVAPWMVAPAFDTAEFLYVLAIMVALLFAATAVTIHRRHAYQLAHPRGPPVLSL